MPVTHPACNLPAVPGVEYDQGQKPWAVARLVPGKVTHTVTDHGEAETVGSAAQQRRHLGAKIPHLHRIPPSVEAPGPEREWIIRAQRGDSEAFGQLVERYAGRVCALLYRLVRCPEEAEDLAQETFVRAFRSLARFDPSRPFQNWLYTIAVHVGVKCPAISAAKRGDCPR